MSIKTCQTNIEGSEKDVQHLFVELVSTSQENPLFSRDSRSLPLTQ